MIWYLNTVGALMFGVAAGLLKARYTLRSHPIIIGCATGATWWVVWYVTGGAYYYSAVAFTPPVIIGTGVIGLMAGLVDRLSRLH